MAAVEPEDHAILQKSDADSRKSKQKMAAVRPVLRNERGALNILPYDETEDQRMRKPQTLHIEEDIELSTGKISLLKASKFQEKNESETIKISFNERINTVKFRTATLEEIGSVKLNMYESLDNIIVKVKKLPAQEYSFLSRLQCLLFFQSKCNTESIIVVYETDKKRQEIKCYSFSEKDSDRGIQLLEDAVTTIIINLRSEHLLRLRDNEWPSLMSTLHKGDTGVYVVESESRVYIKSLSNYMASEAKLKITQYLKGDKNKNTPTKVASATLESSKASCFKMCLEDKLRLEVVKRNGRLEVTELRKAPLLLKVSVEGEEAAAHEMKKVIQQIWHESVDFSTISTAGEDTWLIMKGLDGEQGKEFLSKFEYKHNCFIEVTKDGDTSLPRPRVTIEEVCDTADDDGLKATTFPERTREDSDSDTSSTSDRSEKDVVDLATNLSMQSSSKPVAVVHPDSSIDNDDDNTDEDVVVNDFPSPDIPDMVQQEVMTDCAKSRNVIDKRNYEPSHAQTDCKIRWLKMNNTDVKLVQGAVAKQKADALVNVVSASRGIAEGVVSQSFLEIGGEELSKMYEDAKLSTSGMVVVTGSSGRLQCSTILHVHLQRSHNCDEVVRKAFSNILEECRAWGCRTVSVPPLGVGRMFRFPPEMVAKSMLSEISRQKYKIKRVEIVIHDRDIYDVFEAAFEAFQQPCVPIRLGSPKGIAGALTLVMGACSEPTALSEVRRLALCERGRPECDSIVPAQNHHAFTKEWSTKGASNSSRARQSRDIYNRKKEVKTSTSQKENKQGDGGKVREKKRCSRFPARKPVTKYKLQVVAQNKHTCIQAIKTFGRKMKEKFLYEEVLQKRNKISADSKQKIANIITANSIISVKGKDKYIFRGHKKDVQKAYADVLHALLTEKDNPELTKKRKVQTKRETKEFVEVMVKSEPEVPWYWKNYKEGETLKSMLLSAKHFVTRTKYEKVALASNSREFSTIVRMVNSTFDPNLVGQGKDATGLDDFEYQKLYILKVERIENLHLFEQFTRKRHNFFMRLYKVGSVRFPKLEKIPKCSGCVETYQYVHPHLDKDIHPEINEHLLFHGTKESNVKVICNDGLDPRLGNGNAMFGPGIYASEKATKADQYTDENDNRSAGRGNPKMMFLIRMLLGNTYLCTDHNPHKFRRPPCTRCYRDNCNNESHGRGKFGHTFDSVVGDNRKLFREFVVYDGSLCYPEYLITYERR